MDCTEEQTASMCSSEHSSTSSFEAIDEITDSYMHDDIHSPMPDDIPSAMPDDIPSAMPDDIPSAMPDDIPSFIPNRTEMEYDTYMTDSLESNSTILSSEASNSIKFPPLILISTICVALLFLLSTANVSPVKDCDNVMVEVKQFVEKLKEENEAFKKQLIWEVKQNIYQNLTAQINELKYENAALKQMLKQETTEIMTKLPIANSSKNKSSGQSSKPLNQAAVKKLVVLAVKTIFAVVMAMLLFEWTCQYSIGESGFVSILNALDSFKKRKIDVWFDSKLA